MTKPPFIPGPVASAGRVPLSDSSSGQPVVEEAVLDWFRPLSLVIVRTQIQGSDDPTQDGTAKEQQQEVRTFGCVQPGKGEKLDIMAGGERSWQNALLHTTPDFNVPTDTIIVIKGTPYRIMAKADFSENGYVRYELLEDYARTR